MVRARRALIVVAVMCASVAAQKSAPSASSYPHLIELYRSGREQEAVDALSTWLRSQQEEARDSLLKAFAVSSGAEARRLAADLRVAAMVHTERAFNELNGHNNPEFSYQFNLAQSYVQKLTGYDRTSPFIERWWLYGISRLHIRWEVAAARGMCKLAHATIGDTAELLLACGATEEIGWALEHNGDGTSRMKGDLKDAERQFRSAVAIKPTLVEARLRLGRVLTLRTDPDGMKTLEAIVPGSDDGFSYLARLFEGDALERSGDSAGAERRYQAAIALLPTAQSAYIALAHVRHARGARSEAAADVAALARDRTLPDTSEPWFWYARGAAWRAGGYAEELRSIVRQ